MRTPTFRGALSLAALALAALAVPGLAAAQEPATVIGTVTDAATGGPITDARITIAGTALQSVSDLRGQYRITGVRPGPVTIAVRRIGFRPADIQVTLSPGQQYTGNFALTSSVVILEEVVISGTAGDVTRRAQAATVAEISVSDIARYAPVTTVAQVLQSRVPGVSVLGASGTSGGSTQIRVRGASSISLSNEPLLVIDGVLMVAGANTAWFTGGQMYDRLNELDPADIESIELVKGPAAGTLYGSNASTGVIQIITKRGRVGAGRFTQSVNFEYNAIDRNFEPRTNYAICSEAQVAPESASTLCRGQAAGTMVADSPLLRENAFRTGRTYGVGWSGRGGGQNYGYFTSLAHEDEEGTLPNNAFQRSNGRVNFNWIPTPRVTLDAGIGLTRSRTDLPDNDNNIFGWLGNAQLGLPTTINDAGTGPNGWFGTQRDVAAMKLIENERQSHRTTATLTANWTPRDWFTHRFIAGADWVREEDRRFLPKNDRGSYAINVGQIQELRRSNENYTLDYLGNIRNNLTDNVVSNLSFGFQMTESRNENVNATGEGLTVNSNNVVAAASSRSGGQGFLLTRQVGFIGHWQVGLNDRLFATLGARFDNNSSFGTESEWFFLPKVGVSWVVSEEPFWNLGVVNTLRLRGAWGQTGRAPGPGASLTTLTPAPFLDGTLVAPGAVPLNPGNANLKAERGEEFEGGFDAGFLNDRLGVEVTYFNKTTKDLLLATPLPPSLGFQQNPFANIGEVLNRGWEFSVTAVPVSNRNVSWDVRLGASTLHNEVIDLGEVEPFGTLNRVEEGMQVGAWVTNRILSINEATGEVLVTEDREFYANVLPTFEANLSSNITLLRNLRLYGSIDTKRGHAVRNFSDFFRETQLVRSDNRLDPDKLSPLERLRRFGNPTPGLPAFVTEPGCTGGACAKTVNDVQEAYIQDADFVRLREASLTYTLPSRYAQALRAQGASITLSGQNLALWTDYEGFDPEVVSAAGAAFNRDDFFTLPPGRRFVVKVNLTF